MSESVARAVAAASPSEIVIAGKTVHPRPLGLKELAELERACTKQYVRRVLETYSENLDLYPPDVGQKMMADKIDEVAGWDVADLPLRHATDPARLSVPPALERWLKNQYPDMAVLTGDAVDDGYRLRTLRLLAATSLDNGTLTNVEYREMTGVDPVRERVGYVHWWMTGTVAGIFEMVYLAARPAGVTRDEVSDACARNPALATALAREIETLSSPGNE